MAFRRTAPSPGTSHSGSAPEPPRRARDFVITQLTAKDDALRPRPFFMSEWRL
ncbi:MULTISPECIES: hypothetical protein [unclassified Caulobacter]|uniref:hypothetical protein n=1 Tax=unclassified Caulobacter TaxID=2648921 RepID=UPI000FDB2203|nr:MULTISPECIES: hypothetical protein [unclassified Caulobacter]AZS23355.1 hypothetical protein CSW63_07470 [Caulobacter sp. FWC26]